jgi:hypothetical protein
MTFDRRIWKTGVMAVVATLVFAFVVFRAEQWTKGLNSEFVVYGQSTPSGSGSCGSGTFVGTCSVTKIVPQIVAGSYDGGLTKYSTVIMVTNTGSASINASGNFYTQAGVASTLPLTAGASSITTGVLASTAIAANSTLVIRTGDASTGTTNWARIVTTGSATVSSYFELRDGATNILYTRVGTPSSPADLGSFMIPRVRNTATGLDVGFALVNTGTANINVTITARDASGAVIGTKVQALTPLQHIAQFTNQILALTNEPSGTTYGTVTFQASSATVAVVPLSIEGASLASVPYERLQ